MKKRILSFFLIIFMLLTLTSCWNNRDLSEIAISTAIGIDKTEDGKMSVSIQIIKPSAVKASGKEGGGNGGAKKSFVVVSSTADTVLGALREMLSEVNNKIFYSSAQVIVIGEDAARSGIKDLLDFLERDHETQYKTLVVVSKGVTAKEILEQDYELSNVPGAFIRDTLKNTDSRAFTKKLMLIEVARDLATEGRQLSIGSIEKSGNTTSTEGMFVFLKDKAVGWMDKFETRGYMFATDRVKSTILELENPMDSKKLVAVELLDSSAKESLEWSEDGKPILTVNIKLKCNIAEHHDNGQIRDNSFLETVIQKCNDKVRSEVLAAVRKCQKEYKSDIFGFGMKVFDKNPRYWNQVKQSWNTDIFPDIEVKVIVETKLLRSGIINNSPGMG